MIIDPVTEAGLVTREVRSGSRDGAPTTIAVARRTYRTDRADLWNALTNAERIPRWFLPISGDLRPGGRYRLEGNAGGVIERCDAPELLAVTWEYGPLMSWLEVRLTAAGDGTVLDLSHEAHVGPERWAQFGPVAVGLGWDLALIGLGLHLSSGTPVDRETGLAFPTTPEGTEFVRSAAAGWVDAAVRAGDERTAAEEAAARAVAFFTTPA